MSILNINFSVYFNITIKCFVNVNYIKLMQYNLKPFLSLWNRHRNDLVFRNSHHNTRMIKIYII